MEQELLVLPKDLGAPSLCSSLLVSGLFLSMDIELWFLCSCSFFLNNSAVERHIAKQHCAYHFVCLTK